MVPVSQRREDVKGELFKNRCKHPHPLVQPQCPQIPKPARPLSPAEREDSIQKRQRPSEVNTVLALAGGDSRIEISTLTNDQKALHTAKVNELRNMDNFGVVEVVDRPSSLNTPLGIKTGTGCILQSETRGTRI